MSFMDVVFRVLDKAGTAFIEPRREDGHGSTATNPTNVADSAEREYTHVVATVTAAGSTTIYTPASGKRVRVRWIYAINDPTAGTAVLIRVLFGTTEKYRVYALSKRQVMTGGVNEPLIINLSAVATVAVTVLLEEVD